MLAPGNAAPGGRWAPAPALVRCCACARRRSRRVASSPTLVSATAASPCAAIAATTCGLWKTSACGRQTLRSCRRRLIRVVARVSLEQQADGISVPVCRVAVRTRRNFRDRWMGQWRPPPDPPLALAALLAQGCVGAPVPGFQLPVGPDLMRSVRKIRQPGDAHGIQPDLRCTTLPRPGHTTTVMPYRCRRVIPGGRFNEPLTDARLSEPQASMPPAGRASGPNGRTRPPAAGAPPLDPGDSGMPGPAPQPIAHRRQPDRARVGKVVPVGRSTFPTWAGPAGRRLRDGMPAQPQRPGGYVLLHAGQISNLW
jgi:hypothetical protein